MTELEIRRRIATIEQTKKITGAMEVVSSNRMRQVMNHMEYNHRYFSKIRETMKNVLMSMPDYSHPYLTERGRGHHTFMVISGDKGLCGSHNSAVLDFAVRRMEEFPGAGLITVGHTAEEFFLSRGTIPDITMLGIVRDPTLRRAREVSQQLTYLYDSGLTDDIHVIYTSFYGESMGKPVEMRLLPVRLHDYDDVASAQAPLEIIVHPSAEAMFDMLIPQYTIGLMFGVMVKAYASEHYARMAAMHSATTNAEEMLAHLRIRYNMARQSAITGEIAEITGAGLRDA